MLALPLRSLGRTGGEAAGSDLYTLLPRFPSQQGSRAPHSCQRLVPLDTSVLLGDRELDEDSQTGASRRAEQEEVCPCLQGGKACPGASKLECWTPRWAEGGWETLPLLLSSSTFKTTVLRLLAGGAQPRKGRDAVSPESL